MTIFGLVAGGQPQVFTFLACAAETTYRLIVLHHTTSRLRWCFFGHYIGKSECALFNHRKKVNSDRYKHMDVNVEKVTEMSNTQPGSSDKCSPDGSSLVSRVRKLLFRKMLVGIKDGRFFLGTFHCIDKQGNLILQDAVEYRNTKRTSPSPMEQRGLGLILIPSSCRTTCHVDCSIEEQLSLLKFQE